MARIRGMRGSTSPSPITQNLLGRVERVQPRGAQRRTADAEGGQPWPEPPQLFQRARSVQIGARLAGDDEDLVGHDAVGL